MLALNYPFVFSIQTIINITHNIITTMHYSQYKLVRREECMNTEYIKCGYFILTIMFHENTVRGKINMISCKGNIRE